MHTDTVAGKVVVITGASSGFGKGAAMRFAAEGAKVVAAAQRVELLEELVRDCEAAGGEALAVCGDISKDGEVERLAHTAVQRFGRIDVWINNAGVGAIGPFERIPLADHVQVIATDLLGTLYGSYFAYRQFLKQGGGTLINIASELGAHPVPYLTSYSAAKHGVVCLGDALRQEIGQAGVEDLHVCTVMPTAHDTPFFDHLANYTGREVQAPTPLHDPEDVIEMLVRLARDPGDKEIVGNDGVVRVPLNAAKSAEIENAPPAPDSPGALRVPMYEGTGVSAGRRARRTETQDSRAPGLKRRHDRLNDKN